MSRTPVAFCALRGRQAFLILLLSTPIFAQTPASPAAPAPWTEHTVQSAALGARTIYVSTPPGYAGSRTSYPILVLLDANDRTQFTAALANIAFLSSRGAIPELIVVGIASSGNRAHDFTPVADGSNMQTIPSPGGAGDFTTFIVKDALPFVRSKYRTLDCAVLAGHSFGALFALHVAAASPRAFAGIVAMSAPLWWNDSAAAAAYADSIARTPSPLRLFVTSGGLEPPIASTVARFSGRMDSIVRSNKSAKVAFGHQYYANDTHELTPLESLIDGLRFVFEPVSLANNPIEAALEAGAYPANVLSAITSTEETYARGARSLNLPDKLPEQLLDNVGSAALRRLHMVHLATSVFRENAANHPESPTAFDRLGDALLATGDTAEAKTQFQHALEVAMRTGQEPPAGTKRKLSDLERVIREE